MYPFSLERRSKPNTIRKQEKTTNKHPKNTTDNAHQYKHTTSSNKQLSAQKSVTISNYFL